MSHFGDQPFAPSRSRLLRLPGSHGRVLTFGGVPRSSRCVGVASLPVCLGREGRSLQSLGLNRGKFIKKFIFAKSKEVLGVGVLPQLGEIFLRSSFLQ